MNSFFITGMARSGTTLVEKLLCNHPEISILSQPFPLLFVAFKSMFLEKKGINSYYVLNDTINNSKYKLEEFNNFLETYPIPKKKVRAIFKLMESYSGQLTKINHDSLEFKSGSFIDIYYSLIRQLTYKNDALIYGSKEILCEEFLPHMSKNNIKIIVIVRDPRDVLSSVNYPKEQKYLGAKKPALFTLKTWRKSVEFIEYLKNKDNIYVVKYEDLVKKPYPILDEITNFLKVVRFERDCFNNGIFDQKKQLWHGNSSNGKSMSFISQESVGSYKGNLSNKEIAYTEVICKSEMLTLGYSFEFENHNDMEIIRSFKDYGVKNHPHLNAGFSSEKQNIDIEIDRLRSY